jgi:predicted TIM-barrel fold metal-dependent hydrolase
VGYIDSDAHVREPDSCWDCLDPAERRFRPEKDGEGVWVIDGFPIQGGFNVSAMPPEYTELFPEGSVDLADPLARLRRMDALGIDVQVLFSTFWLNVDISSPDHEAALMRSWNRWMADRVADSGGRLVWTVEVPFRLPERAAAEMEFGRDHGAVGVHLCGLRHGVTVADPLYRAIYEKAQELDLVGCVHVGGDWRKYSRDPSIVFINNLAPVPGAFHALVSSELPADFPTMRWAFVEAGASWLPFAFQEASRADVWGGYRVRRDWRDLAGQVLVNNNFFVTCQVDDDLTYLGSLFGLSNFVHGTDYSHMDVGSDPYGLHIIATRPDLDANDAGSVVDSNARRLWDIDPLFTPAPGFELHPEIIEASRAWTR